MGFGLLFIGYFFLIFFPLDSVNILPNLAFIGCVIMYRGLTRLVLYCPDCKGFRAARITLIPLSILSLALLVIRFVPIGGDISYSLKPTLGLVSTLLICVYSLTVFIGVHKLSRQVELPRLANRAVRMMALSVVYTLADSVSYVCQVMFKAGSMPGDAAEVVIRYIALIAMLLEYISLFLSLALLFTCYIRICLEGDEDMPYREDVFDKIIAWTKRNKK